MSGYAYNTANNFLFFKKTPMMSLSVLDFTIIVEYKGDDSAILFYCDYSNIDYYYSENSIVCRMHGLIVCLMHHKY